jgi:mono/diheme cytochrome c family protein
MSTLLFVLFFVFLGLGVLFVAMSGGPRGIGAALHSQQRGSRRFATLAFFLALIVLGFVVPAAVIALTKDNNDIPHASVTNLTAAEKHGRELFGRRCALCHTLQAANAVAQVGPNLDQIQPNKALVKDAIDKGRSQGNGQMPAQIYTGEDADDVAAFVAKAVGTDKQSGG